MVWLNHASHQAQEEQVPASFRHEELCFEQRGSSNLSLKSGASRVLFVVVRFPTAWRSPQGVGDAADVVSVGLGAEYVAERCRCEWLPEEARDEVSLIWGEVADP